MPAVQLGNRIIERQLVAFLDLQHFMIYTFHPPDESTSGDAILLSEVSNR